MHRDHELRGKGSSGRQFETVCLESEKHMQAIRPYCSRDQHRKSSRRQQQSPHDTRSHSKRLEHSSRHSEERPRRTNDTHPGDILRELIHLKSEYKVLKDNYARTLAQKKEEGERQQQAQRELQEEAERRAREAERWQRTAAALESEGQRLRKECSRVVELERFKVRKLEETLQEKELMIAYLRNELDCRRAEQPQAQAAQPLAFLQNSAPMLNFSYFKPTPNLSLLSGIPADPIRPSPDDDSLSLSRDRSKEADSIIHSFLSNDPTRPRKDGLLLQSLEESPIEGVEPISEKSERSEAPDFRKAKESRDFLDLPLQQPKSRANPRKLQILIADENQDTQNIPSGNLREQLSMETRKKAGGSSLLLCKQKKKLTAKKIKPF